MSDSHNPTLWENNDFVISTPTNPHFPYSEGLHLVVSPKHAITSAWEDPALAAEAFRIASEACRIMNRIKIAPWFNIQANGNWGLLPGAKPFFHVHIYGRNRTDRWAKPIILPDAPGTYTNDAMPENDRTLLAEAFKAL